MNILQKIIAAATTTSMLSIGAVDVVATPLTNTETSNETPIRADVRTLSLDYGGETRTNEFFKDVPDVNACFEYAASVSVSIEADRSYVACTNENGIVEGSFQIDAHGNQYTYIDTTERSRSLVNTMQLSPY